MPTPPFEAREIAIDTITTGGRLRELDADYAALLAASIEEIGLAHPITVRAGAAGEYKLVVGRHRLEAHRLLGRATITARVTTMTDDAARLAEIDENLCRRDLGALDRALHLAERKAVWERMHPETAHGKAKKPKADQADGKVAKMATFADRFTKEVQIKTGISERTVRRSVALVDGLSAETIRLLRLTPLAENAAAIKKLAAYEHIDQLKVLRCIAKGEARSLKDARIATGLASASERSDHTRAFEALMKAWDRATPKARREFLRECELQHIEAPKPARKAA